MLKASVGSVLLKLTSAALVLGLTVLLARSLGPAGYGLYAYVYALVWLLFVPVALGLPMLVVRETAAARAKTEWGVIRGLWRWATRLAVGASLATTGLALLIGLMLSGRLDSDPSSTLIWAVVMGALMALTNLSGAALRGLGHTLQGQVPDFVVRYGVALALCALAAGLLGEAFSADQAMALHALAAAIALGFGLAMLARQCPAGVTRAAAQSRGRTWLTSVIPLAMVSGAFVMHQQTDLIILGLFVDDAEVGIYRVAVQTAAFVALGLHAVNMVAAPQFARLHALGEAQALQRLVTTTARIILVLTVLAAAALIAVGEPVIRLAFGMDYTAAIDIIVILAIGQLFNAGFGSVVFLLNMTGRERLVVRALAVALILNIGLNFALIPPFGSQGAAAATAMTLALWNLLLWRIVRRELGIDSTAYGAPLRS